MIYLAWLVGDLSRSHLSVRNLLILLLLLMLLQLLLLLLLLLRVLLLLLMLLLDSELLSDQSLLITVVSMSEYTPSDNNQKAAVSGNILVAAELERHAVHDSISSVFLFCGQGGGIGTHRSHALPHSCELGLVHGDAHLHGAGIHMLGHQHLPRLLLLLLKLLESLLVQLLVLVEQLGLLRIQVLHCVGVGAGSRWHAAHHSRRVDLGTGTRDAHVCGEVLRDAAGLGARLARVVRHSRSHGVARRYAGMRRNRRAHACHHSGESMIHGVDIGLETWSLSHATLGASPHNGG